MTTSSVRACGSLWLFLPSFLNLTDTPFLMVFCDFLFFFCTPLQVESSSFRFSSLFARYDLKRIRVSVKSVRWFNWFRGCWTFPAWHTGLSDDVSINLLLPNLLIPGMKQENQGGFLPRHMILLINYLFCSRTISPVDSNRNRFIINNYAKHRK